LKHVGFACKNEVDFSQINLVRVKGGYVPNMPHTWKRGVLFKFHGYSEGQFPAVGDELWVILASESRINYSEPRDGTKVIRRELGEDAVEIEAGERGEPFGWKHVAHIYKLSGTLRPNKRGNIMKLFYLEQAYSTEDGNPDFFIAGTIVMSLTGECRSASGKVGIRHIIGVTTDKVWVEFHDRRETV